MFLKSKVADFSLRHTIKYNRLNNEFQVDLPENPQRTLVTRDFEEAKKWMGTVDKLPVIPTCWLDKDQKYYLEVKAELSKVETSFGFQVHPVLGLFVGLRDRMAHSGVSLLKQA